jgi:uncharacterized protein (TIGR03435 family)
MRTFLGVLLAAVCSAQQPAFEVASIKQVMKFQAGTGSEKIVAHPGSLTMRDVRLRAIIMWAYAVKDFQISGPDWLGAPGWGGADVSRFEVLAKAPEDTAIPRMRLMLQQLLAERFRLALHHDYKEVPVMFLAAKASSALKLSADQETEMHPAPSARGLTLLNSTMDDLAQVLSGPLHLPIVNRTGLAGRYDLTFDLPPSPDPNEQFSVFLAALHDLGLELKRGSDKIEFVVVDSAERNPTGN